MTIALQPAEATTKSLPSEDSEESESRRFCWQFTAMLVSILAFVAVLNLVVDPFAQYPGPQPFGPVVQMSRADKLRLFNDLPAAPDGLILGSSRVLKLEPGYLEAVTGLGFFNAGVNYAVPTDHLAWFRYYLDRFGRAPTLVILSLDLSSFSPTVQTDARLITNPTLAPYVHDVLPWKERWARWSELLDWHQVRESLRSLNHHVLQDQTPERIEEYRPDGLLVYLERERQIANGTYDYAGPLEFNKAEYASRYRGFDKLQEGRLVEFEKLAAACRRNETRLVVYLSPMHPELMAHLEHSGASFQVLRGELADHVGRLAGVLGFEFFDLTEIESYGGEVGQFIDGIHQLEPNTRKLIDYILRRSEEGASGAL